MDTFAVVENIARGTALGVERRRERIKAGQSLGLNCMVNSSLRNRHNAIRALILDTVVVSRGEFHGWIAALQRIVDCWSIGVDGAR